MTESTGLQAREGDGDAARTGYWIVTGPQPEHDARATIELSRIIDDDDVSREAYAWYLQQRRASNYDRQATFMDTISRGVAATYDEAMVELTAAWDEHLGLGLIEASDDTAEVRYTWRDN